MKKSVLKAAAFTVAAFALGTGVGYVSAPVPAAGESPPLTRLILQTPPACFEAFNQTPGSVGYEADRLACLKHANN